MEHNNTAKQRQNAVTAYLKNMWLLLFASTEYISCITLVDNQEILFTAEFCDGNVIVNGVESG